MIDDFEAVVHHDQGIRGVIGILAPRPAWKDTWAKAAAIQTAFQGVRYPSPAQRNAAWQRFASLRQEASERAQRETDERRWSSERLRNSILRLVESARPLTFFGFAHPDVQVMKDYGARLREAGQKLTDHKLEMLAEHKPECFQAIKSMREVHDDWWAELTKHRKSVVNMNALRRRWSRSWCPPT